MTLLPFLLAALPCLYWTQGVDTLPALKEAGIERVCVPPDRAEPWKAAGVAVTPLAPADLAGREALLVPGITARAGLASPTRVPWVNANGWRFRRAGANGKFSYEVPAGKAALAAAEASAYDADVVLQIDPADVPALGQMLAFIKQVPPADLPDVADMAVVDDDSPITAEVMNLLSRRNLLYRVVRTPSSQFPLNIKLGTKEFPVEEAADPSAFALKIRRLLTDDKRTLRVYGSEVVVCRVTGDAKHMRVHVLNYSGRDLFGLRFRLRGAFKQTEAYVSSTGRVQLDDQVVADDATEFSIPRLGTYAIVDLRP